MANDSTQKDGGRTSRRKRAPRRRRTKAVATGETNQATREGVTTTKTADPPIAASVAKPAPGQVSNQAQSGNGNSAESGQADKTGGHRNTRRRKTVRRRKKATRSAEPSNSSPATTTTKPDQAAADTTSENNFEHLVTRTAADEQSHRGSASGDATALLDQGPPGQPADAADQSASASAELADDLDEAGALAKAAMAALGAPSAGERGDQKAAPSSPQRRRGKRDRWTKHTHKKAAATTTATGDESPQTTEAPASQASAQTDQAPKKKTKRRRKKIAKRATSESAQVAEATQAASKPPAKPSRPVEDDEDDDEVEPSSGDGTKYEMVINVSSGEECRIAVLAYNHLEEIYIERQSAESHVGSIYKGRVTNVEPSIQAVFVDFGHLKNGFLHISDVHPQYFSDRREVSEDVGRKIPRRDRPPIQRCFRRGQEVVVQVTKEGVGTKGPTLTTYLSIPGRFLVMMPGMGRLGVSRKIEDENDRRQMRDVLNQLELPPDMGFILRTAGMGRTKRELQRDLNYLSRLWKIIADRIHKQRAPTEVYQESDLVIRTIRDVLTNDFTRIIVDDEQTAAKAREFLKIAMPRSPDIVEFYTGSEPIFHKFKVEEEIEKINLRHVPLPLGGSIVIDSTEALVAIDVNSGRFREVEDAEEAAFRVNLQAAEEIARQLRLRDLGGLIVCDFIDMRLERHKREVERCLRNALKKHKERARVLKTSQFGLIEMTRQRQRSSIKQSIYAECPHCRGSGLVKSRESMVLEVLRVLQLATYQQGVKKVIATVAPQVGEEVLNLRRTQLHRLEQNAGVRLIIRSNPTFAADELTIVCEDERGRLVNPEAIRGSHDNHP